MKPLDQLVPVLKALADPKRLEILRLLREPGCCSLMSKNMGMCACDIESRVKLSQPTVSHHMGILRKAGLVEAEKHGQWMWYRRNDRTLKQLAQVLGREL